MPSSFADRLEGAIDNAGINQTALAERLGVTRQTISALKLGKIGRDRVPEIAAILGVDAGWLASGDGAAPPWFVAFPYHQGPRTDDERMEAKVQRLEALMGILTHKVERLQEENDELHLALRRATTR